ncbi:fimbrillin family protein [Bacteroides sp. 214]|uniref:fimbrillin family protein n=1 Tax=Bacteroides sp. 214 TaxID=2302935 RepID=UPI0013D3F509|nr:fimbrillin family protein [Bacteroides sp. 214]NDW11767.1 fimbrillin family protein [Bacteroides sp. 214]
MKINKLFLVGLVTTSVVFSSCSKEDSNLPEQTPIALSSGIDMGIAPTRAMQETQIALNEKLSLFINKASGVNMYENIEITANGSGGFTHTPLYYPMDGSNIDIYAVHPYSSSASLSAAIPFSVQEDQTTTAGYLASDLLYATQTNVARNANAIPLTFAHKLTQLEFTIKKSTGSDLTNLQTVTINGMKGSTTITVPTGALGEATGSAVSIQANGVHGTEEGETEVSGITAIVVPQTVATGVKLFKIGIGGIDYFYTTTSPLTFENGKKYNLQLTINQTGIELESVIEAWGEGDTIIGEGEAE